MPAVMTLSTDVSTSGADTITTYLLNVDITDDTRPSVVCEMNRATDWASTPVDWDKISWSGNRSFIGDNSIARVSGIQGYTNQRSDARNFGNSIVFRLASLDATYVNCGSSGDCLYAKNDIRRVTIRVSGGIVYHLPSSSSFSIIDKLTPVCIEIPSSIRTSISPYFNGNTPTHAEFSFNQLYTSSGGVYCFKPSSFGKLTYLGGNKTNPDARVITSGDSVYVGDFPFQSGFVNEIVIDQDGTKLGLRNFLSTYPNKVISTSFTLSQASYDLGLTAGSPAPSNGYIYCDWADKNGVFISTSSASAAWVFSGTSGGTDYYDLAMEATFTPPSNAYFYKIRREYPSGTGSSFFARKLGEEITDPYPRSPLWDISGSRVPAVLFPQ